ncbi:MAG TPA: hypothetical protein VFP53_05265 [Sphingomicrobium sp.]|nr:hypothetical protein [Sphingomicrobium sp.]
MRACLLVAIAVVLPLGGANAAEPVTTPPAKAGQPAEKTAPVVVASLDQAPAEAAAAPQAQPAAKRARKGRVTTCRCGEQHPATD